LQGTFVYIGGDDGAGLSILQQVNAKIAVVTANVRNPDSAGNIPGTPQQTVR
jgi:hypothetical protein